MRPPIRLLNLTLTAVALAGCVDAFPGTGPTSGSSLVLAPRFSESATFASTALAAAGVSYNSVRLVILRPAADTLKDTTIAFSPSSPETTLELSLAAVPGEEVNAVIQFKQNDAIIFSGSKTIKTVPQLSATRPSAIEVLVEYAGPGATAATVAITPAAGVYNFSSNTQFTAKALNASGAEVANTPIYWSVSDESVATVSATGVLSPKGVRGTVTLTATAANGVSKSISVQLAATAAGLRVVQGAGQRGPVNSTLPVPVVVELIAADGLPAGGGSGLPVTFSTTGGSAFTNASTAVDATGRAQASMILGPTPGRTYIYTATVGSFSVSWGASAAVGTPTKFVASGSTTLTLTAGVVPNPIPTLRVADALDNSVPGVMLKVTIQQNGVNVVAPFSVPADSIGLLEVYRVAPTLAGSYTILIEADPSLGITPLTYNITITPGPAAKLGFTQQPPASVVSGQNVSVSVAVMDQFGNIVTSSTQTISLAPDPAIPGWTVSGTSAATNGVAAFSVPVTTSSGAKTAVKIRATSGTLAAAASNAFNITP
jgi:hypothetical protein